MEKNWILSAIEDLQQLACEHQMPSIAFALDNVMEVAEMEVNFQNAHRRISKTLDQEAQCDSVVQFPEQLNSREHDLH